ncbi:hypothetical protein HDU87_003278 [Geranomyces variabilis]|uniref:Uncharacterized protein n=1 Tax=Geranomyces variabilis TaxID=109894 RepID=A0AAD5TL85_9FUNG|nr:hypothetical protein HDU87_003278 [Geranomyces variabilis]
MWAHFVYTLQQELYHSAQFGQVIFLFLVEKLRVQIANARILKARAAPTTGPARTRRSQAEQSESGSASSGQLTLGHPKTESPLIAAMTALVAETEPAKARQQSYTVLEFAASENIANEVLLLLKTAANPKYINSNCAHNALKALLDILESGLRKGQTRFRLTTKTIWIKSRLERLLTLLPKATKWRPKLLKQCAAIVGAEALRATVLELVADVSAKGKERELATQMENENTTREATMFAVIKTTKPFRAFEARADDCIRGWRDRPG